MAAIAECPVKVREILTSLGIPLDMLASRFLVLHPEAGQLEIADTEPDGKPHFLTPEAASAWKEMKQAASADNVAITIVSAFRTIERQAEIVRRKLQRGLPLETVLGVSAPPGYSEHHSGRAIDVTTEGIEALEEQFEDTEAFRWLTRNASRYGYALSFPRGNRYGYGYEPWHWCFASSTLVA